MKKLLSIILAIAMLLTMLPAAFAADTTEGEATTVTYKFYNGGRSDVSGDWLERIYCTPASALGTTDGSVTYSFTKNSDYTALPETILADPGENWAYIGTNIGKGIGRMTSTDSEKDAQYGSYVALTASTGTTPYLSVNQGTTGEWIAFRVKVPKTANYTISKVSAYKYATAAQAMEMYIVPQAESIEAVFAASQVAEKADVYSAASSGKTYWYGKKSGAKAFSDFGDLSEHLMGKANIYVANTNRGMGEGTLSNCTVQKLEAGKEYYLFLYTGETTSGIMSISELTLTEVEESDPGEETDEPVDHSYIFSGSGGYKTSSYDSFDETTSSGGDKWAVSTYGAYSEGSPAYTQLSSDLKFYTNKGAYGTADNISTRYVIALDVKATGTYDITVNTTGFADGGSEADIYVLSEKDLAETYASELEGGKVTLALLKKLPISGHVTSVGSGETIANKIGTMELEKGTYYMVFNCSSDNVKTLNSGNKNQCIVLESIDLTVSNGATEETPATKLDGAVSFASGADITLNGEAYTAGSIEQLTLGSEVTVEADNTNGNFAGWVRGTEDSGVFVSADAEYTFSIMSGTYLTPVYTVMTEETQTVEFWNENGAYIDGKAVTDGKAQAPTAELAGHAFDNWYIPGNITLTLTDGSVDVSEISEAIIRTVAKYNSRASVGEDAPENAEYVAVNKEYADGTTELKTSTTDLSLDRVRVNGAVQPYLNYGDKVTGTDSAATAWLRDGVIVGYDTTYEHYIWDATNIYSTYDANIEKKPLVVIEDTSIDGAYMIEYDKGNADRIVEAGILFGSTAGIVIGSTDGSKAASQRNDSHGQFCASPNSDEAFARGYLVYENGGSYYVIYTDAASVAQ